MRTWKTVVALDMLKQSVLVRSIEAITRSDPADSVPDYGGPFLRLLMLLAKV